jgi:uncharacterized protein YhdP
MSAATRRRLLVLSGLLLVLAVLAASTLHFAARTLERQIEQALGPNSEVGAIDLRWNAVEIHQLRLRAGAHWPTTDELRAERIRIEPDWRSVFSRQIRIARIVVSNGYLSTLRSTEAGLRLLPSLLKQTGTAGDRAKLPSLRVDRIELADCTMELYDASVRRPPHRIRLEHLQSTIGPVALPDLTGQTRLDLQGVVQGPKTDGRLDIAGWIEVASRDSALKARLRGVDLLALQPYLIKATETGVRSGTLDLDLDVTVKQQHLHAPGLVTLHRLELTEGSRFLGLPRSAILALMKDGRQDIALRFDLDGRLDDPKFRLNENLAARMGASLASSLGISFEGIARGAETVGTAVGSAAQGVGKAFKGLFGH